MIKRIIVPAGLGDQVWLLQKLVNTKEKFNFVLPGGNPRRGHQLAELLPQVIETSSYKSGLSYEKIKHDNIQLKHNLWSEIKQNSFTLSANLWLEQGNKLIDFLPDLPLSHTLPWQTEKYKQKAVEDNQQYDGGLIGIYGSSYSTSRAWGFWGEKMWFELIQLIHIQRPKAAFVIIGASWDTDLSDQLEVLLLNNKIPYINTVGNPLGYVMEMMKLFTYAFYFPSGLPIINETLEGKSDCVMFYPPHLQKMQGTWSDPARTESNAFKECQFCEPREIFDWCLNTYKLLDKL